MTERTRFAVVLYLASMSIACHGFIYPLPSIALSASTSLDMLLNTRDADRMESWVGGERYEMVPLPDSMVDQTVFVGNLCEFVQDGDLSRIFSRVSHLQSVPACVARRANMASLQYGFVTFPCAEEKEVSDSLVSRMRGGCGFQGEPILVLISNLFRFCHVAECLCIRPPSFDWTASNSWVESSASKRSEMILAGDE